MADYASLLRDHITLTCRSIDRLFLQAYVPKLQSVGQVCLFLNRQPGFKIPSSAAFAHMAWPSEGPTPTHPIRDGRGDRACPARTGLCVEELVMLSWDRVSVRPRSGWADGVGKRQKRRRIPLDAEARKVLEAIRPQPAVGAVFFGKRGPYTPRGIEHLLAGLGRRAKVPNVHPHRFRHDTGRRLVEAVDLPTVAAWLGHERLDAVPDLLSARRSCARTCGCSTRASVSLASLHPIGFVERQNESRFERFVDALRGNVKPTIEAVAERLLAVLVHQPHEATLKTVFSALEAS